MRKDNMFRSEEAQAVARTTKELESLSDSIDALQDMINSATGAERQRLQAMEASMQRRKQTLETNQNIATTKFNKKYNTSFASDDISSNVEQQKTAKQTSSKINKAADTLTKSGNLLIDAATKLASVAYDVEFENAMYLAKKRYDRIKNEDKRKVYQKISQHLAYKGFDYDTIKSVLNKIFSAKMI